jgi:hypothetical protein
MSPGQANATEGRESTASLDEFSSAIVARKFYNVSHPSVCSDGEHRLMLAVLKTAISDYLQGSDSRTRDGRRLSVEVGAWMSEKSTAAGVFAYEEVCESLGIDPDRLRQRLSWLANQSMVLRLQSSPVRPADQLRAAQ